MNTTTLFSQKIRERMARRVLEHQVDYASQSGRRQAGAGFIQSGLAGDALHEYPRGYLLPAEQP